MRAIVSTLLALAILVAGLAAYATLQWRHNLNLQSSLHSQIASLRHSINALSQSAIGKTTDPKSIYPSVITGGSLVINYDDFGFMPNIAVVPKDTTIVIDNTTDEGGMNFMQVPTQTNQNPELNVGIISKGQAKSFKLTRPGTWIYENSWETTDMGQITVQ